jgi:hypothetical protein
MSIILEAVWVILSEGNRWKRSKSLPARASLDLDMEEAEAEGTYIVHTDIG